jgi:hypothetical protein
MTYAPGFNSDLMLVYMYYLYATTGFDHIGGVNVCEMVMS